MDNGGSQYPILTAQYWKNIGGTLLTFFKRKRNRRLFILTVLFTWYLLCLPSKLFTDPCSTVLVDKDGGLLCAKIAEDGQWRFPGNEEVPLRFKLAIVQFEDKNFYYHHGFNPLAFCRAIVQNIKAGKIVSGGSTLTMQTIRLSRKGKRRTFYEKFIEIVLASRLELSSSKNEVIALYASHAPFGSNVVGLDAAAWRYFGRSPKELSWAETATLAVLPNAPSLIYPGKNHDRLKAKRDRLLNKLFAAGYMDAETCELSKQEPLPEKPCELPQLAPHLLTRVLSEGGKGQLEHTTIDAQLQKRVTEIIEKHHRQLKGNGIHNAAALVLDVETGTTLAYIGNTENKDKPEFGSDVDVITAPRSTGSILKPYLFASMLRDGELLANTLVPDIPTQIAGYSPQNFNLGYDGAVPAKRALARSLNIPAVKMLQSYGVEKFHYQLRKLGMSTIDKPSDHYGLSIILGGAEGKLWEIAGIYAGMARTLNHYTRYNGKYDRADFHPPTYIYNEKKSADPSLESESIFDAASLKITFDAMVEVSRPDEQANWKLYTSSARIAWKTGTSFGYRDGWAVGVTPKNVVAVWVGNANGEGRPGLTGIGTAAPILFDIFALLKPAGWFEQPYDEMQRVPVCRQSGCRAIDICSPVDTIWVQKTGLRTKPCPYHRIIHLDASSKWRVNSDCEEVANMNHVSWFVLPPSQEWYYKSKNPSYRELPPLREDCASASLSSMELIYPKQVSKIYVPVELDGKPGRTVFKVAHRKPGITIHWHLDEKFMGSTTGIHELGFNPEEGVHRLILVDEEGESLEQAFEIIGKKKQGSSL